MRWIQVQRISTPSHGEKLAAGSRTPTRDRRCSATCDEVTATLRDVGLRFEQGRFWRGSWEHDAETTHSRSYSKRRCSLLTNLSFETHTLYQLHPTLSINHLPFDPQLITNFINLQTHRKHVQHRQRQGHQPRDHREGGQGLLQLLVSHQILIPYLRTHLLTLNQWQDLRPYRHP